MNVIDWSTLEPDIDELPEKIRDSGADFDRVVGILHGGVIPARLLVARLAIRDGYALNIRKRGENRVVTTALALYDCK